MCAERLFHVTVMSNFARAYDKYARTFSKAPIPESKYPDQFFLLRREELAIGVAKTQVLLKRTRVPGDRMLAIETRARPEELIANARTGLGRFVERNWVEVNSVHSVLADGSLSAIRIEEAWPESLRLLTPTMKPFSELRPRSVSLLPIAIGCQAACPFCYSKASASANQLNKVPDLSRIKGLLRGVPTSAQPRRDHGRRRTRRVAVRAPR